MNYMIDEADFFYLRFKQVFCVNQMQLEYCMWSKRKIVLSMWFLSIL